MDRVRLEAFFDMTQDFIDAVRDGRSPPVTGEDGLAAVRSESGRQPATGTTPGSRRSS